jgi:trehalose-phosphatase
LIITYVFQRTIDALNDLLSDEKNTVYVMSGRTPEELDQLFKRVPNLGLIAENGSFLKSAGTTSWTEMSSPEDTQSWKDSVTGILEYYQERTPGSWIETRHCSLVFHYKNAEDFETASRQAGDCASHINDACEDQNVRAVPIEGSWLDLNPCSYVLISSGAVIVESTDFTKGTAAEEVIKGLKETVSPENKEVPVDFLMVAGDGREDEVIFRWANELGSTGYIENVTTVSLGSRNTEAMKTMTQGVTGKSSLVGREIVLLMALQEFLPFSKNSLRCHKIPPEGTN